MDKKIDLTALEKAQLTAESLELLKSNGARVLPNNPTSAGWSPDAIKKQLYKQAEILFFWIQELASAELSVSKAIDQYLYDVSRGKETPKVYATLAAAQEAMEQGYIQEQAIVFVSNGTDLSAYYTSAGGLNQVGQSFATFLNRISTNENDIDSLEGRATTLEGRMSANDAEEATHHHLKTDRSGYIIQEFPTSEGESTSDERIINHNDGVAIANETKLLKEAVVAIMGLKGEERILFDKMVEGTISVGYASRADRAGHDGNGNLIDVTQYGNSVSLSYEQATGKLTVKLYNKAGNEIDSKVIDLPSELVFIDEYYDSNSKKLVFVPASGGSNIEIPLNDLVDTYTEGTDSEGIAVVSINNHVIKVSIADGSISMAKLSSTLQTTWNGWVSAEAARVLAEQGRVAAEAQRVANENARLAMPHLDIDNQGYLIINYGSGRDITID